MTRLALIVVLSVFPLPLAAQQQQPYVAGSRYTDAPSFETVAPGELATFLIRGLEPDPPINPSTRARASTLPLPEKLDGISARFEAPSPDPIARIADIRWTSEGFLAVTVQFPWVVWYYSPNFVCLGCLGFGGWLRFTDSKGNTAVQIVEPR